jgi:hypothetical protein
LIKKIKKEEKIPMKKNNHYTLNFTDEENEKIQALAKKWRRKPSEMLALLVVDSLAKIEKYTDEKETL